MAMYPMINAISLFYIDRKFEMSSSFFLASISVLSIKIPTNEY